MGAVIVEITRGQRVAATTFVAAEAGEVIDLVDVISLRLVGIYCCKPRTIPVIAGLYQLIVSDGTLLPRDQDYESGICLILFRGSSSAVELKPNTTVSVPQGTTELTVLLADRFHGQQDETADRSRHSSGHELDN